MRGAWFVAGTAAGIYATSRARRVAEAVTAEGIHDRLTGWFAGARVLRTELRAGMREKESELLALVDRRTQAAAVESRRPEELESGSSARPDEPAPPGLQLTPRGER